MRVPFAFTARLPVRPTRARLPEGDITIASRPDAELRLALIERLRVSRAPSPGASINSRRATVIRTRVSAILACTYERPYIYTYSGISYHREISDRAVHAGYDCAHRAYLRNRIAHVTLSRESARSLAISLAIN